ncbi:hypothetical protein MJO28_007922 [Puccinia striiformis f. sp. tritici]|uniref:Uncharacterized protein n=4 Tax=Puccinia striiformis TaxID=27350 RepID=A0A0L0V0A9_9BASI|nr:hypothetical protein Pst134EA_016000 [Puccinia striiformis f. sp. tritici]KAI9610695.1 hypothetical protein KEM48_002495 [Puccinia striiformis f. sp. tritici PST-130]KNE92621.1 hypothetical protein PSTG_13945 [Puccinia striiformis f. sp. tritici PST-78]POV97636.1 hypothetical protein PSHT_14414 [Puccinia striiformis]KAH9453129.1 hypothetical protein Pst134EB_017062 [Puccinia striiformis f. sp. tritici]KAH9463919.1 hypothetical protein Pst134EA_016000 [Puccinia striiformis f. sp. tritici]
MSELGDTSTERHGLDTQLLKEQAGLVIKHFKSLDEVDFFQSDTTPTVTSTDLSIERLRSRKPDLFNEVQSTLLPLLEQQIASISKALKVPKKVRKDPGPVLNLLLEILPKLEQTLDQTVRAINDIIPGQVPLPNQTHDQHFRELKCFRLNGLSNSFRWDLRSSMSPFFSECKQVIEKLQSPINELDEGHLLSFLGINLRYSFGKTIKWVKGSELKLISDSWENALRTINDALEMLSVVVYTYTENGFSQAVSTVAKPLILITRLSQLFFKKLLGQGMRKTQVPFCTEMSSQQLDLLHKSVGHISRSISEMAYILNGTQVVEEQPIDISEDLMKEIDLLLPHFQICLFLADLYIIPILPDINVSSSQIYFKTWFVAWNTMFSQATHIAIQASHVYRHTGQ